MSYDETVTTATAVLIAGGVSAYLIGLAAIRRRMRLGPLSTRIGLAILALPTVLVGAEVSALGQLRVLGAVLMIGIVFGRRQDHAGGGLGSRHSRRRRIDD